MDMSCTKNTKSAQLAEAGHWRTIVKNPIPTKTTKIFLITADYRNPPVTSPYAVKAQTKQRARAYFANRFPWLRIYKVEEFTGDPSSIQWYW